MRTLGVTAVVTCCQFGNLAAQDASPYVPLHHWGMPYVEHLVARGALVDPAPLTRPLKQAELLRALQAMDSGAVSAGEWRVVTRLAADLVRRERGPIARVDGRVAIAAATHARRDPLREAGPGHATGSAGLALSLFTGPVVVATNPFLDTRLKYDPDYQGKKDRVVAGRNAEAYASAQWRFGELFFGSLDRNWGPTAVEGLALSPSPYSYEHFGVALGTTGVRFEGALTQLDDWTDSAGTVHQRYLVAHRLVIRPPGATSIALWEASLLAGPDRELEPWYANIFNLGLLAQYDQGSAPNNLIGIDVQSRLGRMRVFGSLLIDDIQVDRRDPGDREPTAYGVTLGAQRPMGRASVTAVYTRIANLTYRTPNPAETYQRRGVGLARNFSDYDQLTLRGGVIVGPGVLVQPEVTLLRQGEGDFRDPYPPVSAFPTTPTFLTGVVERTIRVGLAARWDAARVGIVGDGGIHVVTNAGHVTGADDTRFVGTVTLSYRFRKESLIP